MAKFYCSCDIICQRMNTKNNKSNNRNLKYWMVVETLENFRILKDSDFEVFGFQDRFDQMTQSIRENDRILFYLSCIKSWAATATIKSEIFHDESPLYGSESEGELRPNRIKLQPRMILKDDEFIDASAIAPRLDYLKFWYPEDWPLAFIELVHLLPSRDFRLIESEMKRIIIKDSSRRNSSKES